MLLVAQFLILRPCRIATLLILWFCLVCFSRLGVARRYVHITVLFGSLASCSQRQAFADAFCLIWPLGLVFASSYDIASFTWQVWLTCLACCSCYQGFAYAFVFVTTLNLLACCSYHRGCHNTEFIQHADLAIGASQMCLLFVMTLDLFSTLLLPSGLCSCVYYLSRR